MPPGPFLSLVNLIRSNKQQPPFEHLDDGLRLREELGFDSFDLAELTVRIEDRFGVDVFAEGIVRTVGEVRARIGGRAAEPERLS
jgi:acyl carrier protein